MTDTAAPASAQAPAPPAPRRWLAVGLAIVAAIETFAALYDLGGISMRIDQPTPLLFAAQWLVKLKLAIAPLFAGTVLVLALMGRLRLAIMVLAALILLRWLAELPLNFVDSFELGFDALSLLLLAQRLLYPVFAAAALLLARRNQRPELATLLVSLPALIAICLFVLLAITISINGT